jgi:UDP-N-acetyl-2-amino-2-deoxyglucuronate dehydrogenase
MNQTKKTKNAVLRTWTTTNEFSDGFTDLHTDSYKHILDGGGFGLDEAGKSISLVHSIRNKEISPLNGDYHPFAKLPKANHPFKI